MASSKIRSQFSKRLELLTAQCRDGWLQLKIHRELLRYLEGRRILQGSAEWCMYISMRAHKDMALCTLARLTDSQSQTHSIQSLLDFIERYPDALPAFFAIDHVPATEDVRRAVEEDRLTLSSRAPLIARILDGHNRGLACLEGHLGELVVAHVTRGRIDDADLAELFMVVYGMLARYARMGGYATTELGLDYVETGTEELIRSLESAGIQPG